MATPEYDPVLIEDLMELQPELATHLYKDGQRQENVALFMAGVFGKTWYVEIKDYTQAGIWRDHEIAAKELIDPAEQQRIRSLVRMLFLDTEEKRNRDAELRAIERAIALMRGDDQA